MAQSRESEKAMFAKMGKTIKLTTEQIEQLPDDEIARGLRNKEHLTSEIVNELKQEKSRRLNVEQEEKNKIEEAKRDFIPDAIFYNEGDIESVDYDFTKNGRIFYPNGFEKEILLNFNAKKLSDKQIDDLIQKLIKDKQFEPSESNKSKEAIRDEFLQEHIENNTRFTDSLLDDDLEFGSVTTDEEEEDERQYFVLREIGSDNKIYDVTDLKGEQVSGTGEPLLQIRDFLFPSPSLLFKHKGKQFEYNIAEDVVSVGFGDGSPQEVTNLQSNKLEGINIVLEDFLKTKGKERR